MTLQAHHLDYIEANALLRQLANDVQGGLDLSDDDDDDMLFNDDDEEDREEARSQGGGAQQTRTKETKSATPALDNFGTDLTAAALEGKLDPVVGREREIIRVSEILGRRIMKFTRSLLPNLSNTLSTTLRLSAWLTTGSASAYTSSGLPSTSAFISSTMS